ncbi:hypothetical protein ECC02_004312 [Trypanosoma cruzi]|uniref:Uncharacterized protein n=1 Tax=Trypanosoma cruzi TaxID=5693 RepID=A0A7J6Y882_TRYCR|nr:hypothetical protein ECC02_004312 [Trypanosoma cruzi]
MKRMTPRAGNTLTHGGHRAGASVGLRRNAKSVPHASIQWHRNSHRRHTRSSLAISARDATQRPAVAKNILSEHCATTYVCVCWSRKRSKGRHIISTERDTAGWQKYMRHGHDPNNHARWRQTHRHTRKKTNKKNTAAGCGCVCGAAGVCPPWPQKKQNKRGRNVCSAPQALVARPHVTAPSARRSSRPLLMRAAGEAHRAVVMSVSVGVRVEQLGGKHTAPLTGRVQKKQLTKVEKKKTSIVVALKQQAKEGK